MFDGIVSNFLYYVHRSQKYKATPNLHVIISRQLGVTSLELLLSIVYRQSHSRDRATHGSVTNELVNNDNVQRDVSRQVRDAPIHSYTLDAVRALVRCKMYKVAICK